MLPILGLLALAVVVVIVLLRFMRPGHSADARRVPPATANATPPAPAPPPLSKEEQEYLDSSHILPAGRGPLDTRADDWRNDKRT